MLPRISVRKLSHAFLSALVLTWTGVILGDMALLGLQSVWGSLAIHVAWYFALVMVVLGIGAVGSPLGATPANEIEVELALLIVALFGTATMFGLICRDLHFLAGGGFSGSPPRNSRFTWIAYGLDNTLECMLIDFPSVYELQFTRIKPSSFWSQSVVMAFRLSVDFFLAKALLQYFIALRRRTVLAQGRTSA